MGFVVRSEKFVQIAHSPQQSLKAVIVIGLTPLLTVFGYAVWKTSWKEKRLSTGSDRNNGYTLLTRVDFV
jgi:hypothetical protein